MPVTDGFVRLSSENRQLIEDQIVNGSYTFYEMQYMLALLNVREVDAELLKHDLKWLISGLDNPFTSDEQGSF